jgi:hypothetical protein
MRMAQPRTNGAPEVKRLLALTLIAVVIGIGGCSKPSPEEEWVDGVGPALMVTVCEQIQQFEDRAAYVAYWTANRASVPEGAKDLDPGALYDVVTDRCSTG